MSYPRSLALALLVLLGCEPAPGQPAASAESAPPLMKRSLADAEADGQPLETATTRTPAKRANTASNAPEQPYDRKSWPHWIDTDHDCQDARTEVLVSESYEDVSFEDAKNCEVSSGAWQCPYTGKLIKQAHMLDVDHLVPLSNAHRSGGASWDQDRRRRYANDLEHPEHLVAVDYVSNRSKGDRGPEAWLPPSEEFRCTYVRDWVQVKQRWQLSMTPAEAAAIDDALALCEAGRFPPLPQERVSVKPSSEPSSKGSKPSKASKPKAQEGAEPSERSCCRTCKSGKACGDSCIAQTSSCTKPPGCACDG